jgi:hypothetical protein
MRRTPGLPPGKYRGPRLILAITESCSLIEVVALLSKHSELELQILNGHGAAVATERELEATWRRLSVHPQALSAVLQTARAMRRTPDTVSVRGMVDWVSSN